MCMIPTLRFFIDKLCLFILLLWCIAFKVVAQPSSNYLNESIKIAGLAKKSTVQINFTVSTAATMPVPDANFTVVYNKVMALYGQANAVNNSSTTNTGNTGGPVTVPVGAVGSSGAPAGAVGGQAAVTGRTQTLTADISEEIRTELIWVLFLKYDTVAQHYIQLAPYFPKSFKHLDVISAGIGNTSGNTTGFAFSESAIIYGLADFVISRAKEEMVNVYLKRWYDQLNANRIAKITLPQTLSILNAFNQDNSLNLAKYGDKWKAAFEEDIQNIPVVLQDESFVRGILDTANVDSATAKQLIPVIAGGDQIIYNLYLKKHLVNVLSELGNKYMVNAEPDPAVFKRMVVLANTLLAVSGSMSNNNTYQAVSLQDINQMDIAAWQIMLKLVYMRQYQPMAYTFGAANMQALFLKLTTDVNKLNQFVLLYKQSISQISSYQNMINAPLNAAKSELNFNDSRKLFDLSFQFVGQVSDYISLYQPAGFQPVIDTYKTATPYYNAVSEIGEGVANKQYGTVLDGTVAVLRLANKNNRLDTEIKYLQVFGSFMVNILTAKDADQVQTALDEIIPQGQYQQKNTNRFSVSLSAYPGAIVAVERVSQYRTDAAGSPILSQDKKGNWGFAPALFLPIGLDFSLGYKSNKTASPAKYASTNLMLQVLDLGAVLNYRLSGSNSDVEADPNITFKQVLSPGLSLMQHLSNSPVTFGINASYSPELRTISQNGNDYKSGAFRVGAFIAVDVTFFNLFTH